MPMPQTYSFSLPATLTGNAVVDSLISGTYWLGANWDSLGDQHELQLHGAVTFTSSLIQSRQRVQRTYELTAGQKCHHQLSSSWSAVANRLSRDTDNLANVGDYVSAATVDGPKRCLGYFPANTPTAEMWVARNQ